MSPLWLIIIIPLSFSAGYLLCGFFESAKWAYRCTKCQYGDPFAEEEEEA